MNPDRGNFLPVMSTTSLAASMSRDHLIAENQDQPVSANSGWSNASMRPRSVRSRKLNNTSGYSTASGFNEAAIRSIAEM